MRETYNRHGWETIVSFLLFLQSMETRDEERFYKPLRVAGMRQEATDFYTIRFAEEDAGRIRYQSGQYLTLVHQFRNTEERRSYSITSAPSLGESLCIGVKRIPNGVFSRYLADDLHPGNVVMTTGAAGLFVLPADVETCSSIYLFAAGSGITPIYSLLKTILHVYSAIKVMLVYSNHSPESAPFLQHLQQLAIQNQQQFTLHLLFSNQQDIYRARLHRDLLLRLVSQQQQPGSGLFTQTLAYVCGPLNYRRMCLYTLQEAGIPEPNIKKETFDTSLPVVVNEPPDKTTRNVEIHTGGNVHQLTVQYPDTILKAARKKGILLPYSCEAGKCGNCSLCCTGGEVWMSYNEVLTARDIANGLVLTCTGHPVHGDVVLRD